MRFLILGAGALGGYFGARLIKGGADVTFLVRLRREQQLQRDGLVVHTQDGETLRYKVHTVQKGGVDKPFDVVLLTCKAYDLDAALEAITPAVGPGSAVLPLLNGVLHIDLLVDGFGKDRVLGGLTAVNASLLPDGTIQQSALRVNMNILGELAGGGSARCSAIQSALAAGGIPADISPNIISQMRDKMFGYCVSATITSLTRARAGTVVRAKSGPGFVSAVIAECVAIATAEGYPPPNSVVDIMRGMFSDPHSVYGPSLLIDMEEGRPTEAEHTIGDLVSRASRRGVPAPILTAALCNLQAYELNRAQQNRAS
jgi:2-dehydropantoate 2-reductase